MINFILTKILKSRGFAIALILGLIIFFFAIFVISYFETKTEILNCKNEIKEYKRMEEEVKVYHEENIEKLKQSIQNAKKNAKKNDFNDTGNLDDDFLLKALE